MAEGSGGVDVSLVFGVKVIFGTNHGKDFTGFGTGDEDGTVGDVEVFKAVKFFVEGLLGEVLEFEVKGRVDVKPSMVQVF